MIKRRFSMICRITSCVLYQVIIGGQFDERDRPKIIPPALNFMKCRPRQTVSA